jgi:hypothetical protein
MKIDSMVRLCSRHDINDYVMSLWSDGPIRQSHKSGGLVQKLVDHFAAVPRYFYEASDKAAEWTHFSAWWGGILLGSYDNKAIQDLRYLHEIFHAATMPHIAGINLPTFELKNFRNEREASTFTEMAIYLELPELRSLTFDHPIFADRFIFPSGNRAVPDDKLLSRWRSDRDVVFQELLYARTNVVLADAASIDAADPQIIWLRRYSEQGRHWLNIWQHRFVEVENALAELKSAVAACDRIGAGKRYFDWLLSDAVCGGTDIPFHQEATAFRTRFDELIAAYDDAMKNADQTPVKNKA